MALTRNVLTPEALAMMDTIARTGSFAAAARELGKVPSALTYNVRQLEDALDVLLFDRSSRQAQLTDAGTELLAEGRRLLEQIDAVANRVRRVGSGWETQLTLAVDDVMSRTTLLDLCERFYALRPWSDESHPPAGHAAAKLGRAASGSRRMSSAAGSVTAGGGVPGGAHDAAAGPGTRIRLRTEVLAGTWEALTAGQADLALGVPSDAAPPPDVEVQPLGELPLVFAVAPHHPLARHEGPITDAELIRHRAVAVADSAQRLDRITVNLLPGQEVLTVSSMQDKVEAQLRCLGCGFLPEPLARAHLQAGHLVACTLLRAAQTPRLAYAWRSPRGPKGQRLPVGKALQWWLDQLALPTTRRALIDRQGRPTSGVVSYRGRFAPSPTGLLHPGSMVAALGSWLDARAHAGRWLVRIEDTDAPRCSVAAAEGILGQLARVGLVSDEPVRRQSAQGPSYRAALAALQDRGLTYRCRCSRRDLALWWAAQPEDREPLASHPNPPAAGTSAAAWAATPAGDHPYPGLCRTRAWPADGPGAVRLRTDGGVPVIWIDRRLGRQHQQVDRAVGDFVLLRADGLWAYQLAMVVDDGEQGITQVVRGEDLADNTPRQILLQRALGWPQPGYLHLPLVLGTDGRKLSKQNGATPLDLSDPVRALAAAATVLGLPPALGQADSSTHTLGAWLEAAAAAWPWRLRPAALG